MSLQITGTILKVLPQQTGTGAKGQWIKQDFLIETTDQYPKKVLFTAFGADKTEIVNKLIPGTKAEVHFNVESREHNERWYTTLTAWKVLEAGKTEPNSQESNSTNTDNDDSDNLPF